MLMCELSRQAEDRPLFIILRHLVHLPDEFCETETWGKAQFATAENG
jgi:hypothetical protein